jgi:hypothetical protein
MKKFVIAALAATSALGAPAFAQNASGVGNSDSMVITANIPEVCTVSAPVDITVTNFQTNGSGGSLGNVNINCNDPEGFTFSTATANGGTATAEGSPAGLLVPTDSAADTSIVYRVVANGQTLFGAPKQAGDLETGATPATYIGGHDIPVSYVSSGFRSRNGGPGGAAFAGIYQDTVTFTVASN